jgi:hypothetical protein
MKSAVLAVCLIGIALLAGNEARAQGLAFGYPVYAAPVYPTAVYPTTVYTVPAYPTTTVYYSAPAAVYSPAAVYATPYPYAVSAPVVVGAPYSVYGYWGRRHGHVYYRW